MADYWDKLDNNGPSAADDLKAYLEERKRQAARYLRTAKLAQQRIDQIQAMEERHRKALGLKT